jgi:hypothetical protein
MVYLVAGEDVTSVVGCHDDDLLADVLEVMADDLADLDSYFNTGSPEYGPGLTFAQAMRQLFAGQFSRPDQPFVYAYAFEEVCRYFGEWLSNDHFHRCQYSWFEQLDERLATSRVPLRFADLLGRMPAALPDTFGEPCLGHWRADEAEAALPVLDALLPRLSGKEAAALGTVRGWLAQAGAWPGSIIVGVFC